MEKSMEIETPSKNVEEINHIMEPKSIAIIGASTRLHTVGSDLVKKLLIYKYTGKIFLVNVKGGVIEGLNVYKSVTDIEDEIECAVIIVNAKFILPEIEKCGKKGVKGLVIISSGFKEIGTEAGIKAENEIIKKCKEYNMRLVGPNSLGIINTDEKYSLDACFAETLPIKGDIGFVSQSGALGGGILNILQDLNLGFAQFISIGNQGDLNSEKVIEYWENNPKIKQILLYMESICDPKQFLKISKRVSKKKPILAMKAGRTEAGAKAAMSHTGSLAGTDRAMNYLLKQAGVIREYSLKNMFNTAKVFTGGQKFPKGDKIAVVTNSGGPAIMCTDAIIESGMKLAQLSDKTKEELKTFLPGQASIKNPVDMIASAPLDHYIKTVSAVLADENVDMVIVIYLPFLELKDIDVAKALFELKAKTEKPMAAVFMTNSKFFCDINSLNSNLPFYLYVEEAVNALYKLNRQRLWVERPEGEIKKFETKEENLTDIKKIFIKAKEEGRDTLNI